MNEHPPETPDGPGWRCFLAIVPPMDLCQRLAEISEALNEKATGVRWVSPNQMHVTLRFFPAALPTHRQRIAAAAESMQGGRRRFTLRLVGVGGFPHLRQPNVVWAGVEDKDGRLKEFYRALEIALFDRDIGQDRRPFAPHLTLARIKRQMKGAKLEKLLRPWHDEPWGEWPVEFLTFYRSHPGPTGTIYETLGEWPLG